MKPTSPNCVLINALKLEFPVGLTKVRCPVHADGHEVWQPYIYFPTDPPASNIVRNPS